MRGGSSGISSELMVTPNTWLGSLGAATAPSGSDTPGCNINIPDIPRNPSYGNAIIAADMRDKKAASTWMLLWFTL